MLCFTEEVKCIPVLLSRALHGPVSKRTRWTGADGRQPYFLIEAEPHDLFLFFFLAYRFLNSVGRSCFKGSMQNSKRAFLKQGCVCTQLTV